MTTTNMNYPIYYNNGTGELRERDIFFGDQLLMNEEQVKDQAFNDMGCDLMKQISNESLFDNHLEYAKLNSGKQFTIESFSTGVSNYESDDHFSVSGNSRVVTFSSHASFTEMNVNTFEEPSMSQTSLQFVELRKHQESNPINTMNNSMTEDNISKSTALEDENDEISENEAEEDVAENEVPKVSRSNCIKRKPTTKNLIKNFINQCITYAEKHSKVFNEKEKREIKGYRKQISTIDDLRMIWYETAPLCHKFRELCSDFLQNKYERWIFNSQIHEKKYFLQMKKILKKKCSLNSGDELVCLID